MDISAPLESGEGEVSSGENECQFEEKQNTREREMGGKHQRH